MEAAAVVAVVLIVVVVVVVVVVVARPHAECQSTGCRFGRRPTYEN